MKFAASSVLLAGLAAGAVAQSPFTLGVVDHTQCASTEIVWEGGVAPFALLGYVSRNGAAAPIIDTSGIQGTSYPFLNNAAAGYTIDILITDSKGHTAQTEYAILESSDTSCLPGAGWGRRSVA